MYDLLNLREKIINSRGKRCGICFYYHALYSLLDFFIRWHCSLQLFRQVKLNFGSLGQILIKGNLWAYFKI